MSRKERELDEELQFHLEQSADAYERAGHSKEEAMRRARLDLHVESVKEDVRDARGGRWLTDLGADLRYGVRVLRKSPAFTLIAVLTLALGIGANTAMFAVVEDVLLHPLPYEQPGQLVRLHASKPSFDRGSISYPNFLDWQAQNHSFAAIGASRGAAFTMTEAGAPERVSADLVSPNYFTVLGASPLLGHMFTSEDAVVLLGEKLWRRKFAASRDVVGKRIVLDGTSYAVAGVMPAKSDLRAVSGGQPADVYIPIAQRDRDGLQARGAGMGIHGIGRLKLGVTIAQARADLAGVTGQLALTYPETNKSVGATIDPLDESVIGNLKPYLLVLFAAVGLLLLIACVNVANLLLARATVRSHELAIRVAVGASFGRLMRQLLTESLLLALAGGAFGLLVAWWSTDVLLAMLPGRLSRVEVHSLDGGVLVFTVGLSLVAGVLTGVMPALKAIRPNLYDTIKEGGRGVAGKIRAQSAFVVLQTAMAVVLLIGAGLLVRTMLHLNTTDPGYRPNHVVTFGLSLSPEMQKAPPATIRAALHDLQTSIAAAPGVEAAAFTLGVPMESGEQSLFYVEGKPRPATSDEMSWTVTSIVGPEYLATMKVPLQRGRFFTERDNQNSPDVVVIDDAFARRHFPGEDPIGKRIHMSSYDFAPVEIIGVVGHVKMWGLDQEQSFGVSAQLYMTMNQLGDPSLARAAAGITVMARTHGDGAMTALRSTIERQGAENVVFRIRTANEIISGYQATRRFAMYTLVAFAALALLLCCVGIYGVVSYAVARRTTEIGIRMALGATASIIMGLVVREGLKLTLAGVAIGIAAACAVTRFMTSMLFGVPPIDLPTFAAVSALVTVIALAALVIPARRAMRLDVMQALRTE